MTRPLKLHKPMTPAKEFFSICLLLLQKFSIYLANLPIIPHSLIFFASFVYGKCNWLYCFECICDLIYILLYGISSDFEDWRNYFSIKWAGPCVVHVHASTLVLPISQPISYWFCVTRSGRHCYLSCYIKWSCHQQQTNVFPAHRWLLNLPCLLIATKLFW